MCPSSNLSGASSLPPLDPSAEAHCQRVKKFIIDDITEHHNKITFARYMADCLYTPGLGYYSAGARKFGRDGDFITAPEISPLFARCLANHCAVSLKQIANGKIIEFGAGTGSLAADLLLALEQQEALPSQYLILEISADLKQRQQQWLAARCPHLVQLVHWLERLPTESLAGIVIANEVLDAMPVHRFQIHQEQISEYYVSYQDQEKTNPFIWQLEPPSSKQLLARITAIKNKYLDDAKETEEYTSEINLVIGPWLQSIADFLTSGEVLLIDYGFGGKEYYHPQRNQGTLMCHYRHRAHDNPLILPGLQDVTAHVDFTAVAEFATLSGFQVAGFTTQANFLIDCGIALMAEADTAREQMAINSQIKLLTLPSEMGELFKVMALTKKFTANNSALNWCGFSQNDQRHRL